MENKPIKNRLYQALQNRSPKHPFLLEDPNKPAPILKPKKIQEASTSSHRKPVPVYHQGKLLLSPIPTAEQNRKRPE